MSEQPRPEPDRDHDHRPDPASTVPANTPPEDPDDLATDPTTSRPVQRPEDPKIEDETVVRTREAGKVGPKLS